MPIQKDLINDVLQRAAAANSKPTPRSLTEVCTTASTPLQTDCYTTEGADTGQFSAQSVVDDGGGRAFNWIGTTLLSFHPSVANPNLYAADVKDSYLRSASLNFPPHIFGIAERVRRLSLFNPLAEQSIVVMGDAAAGKTHMAKEIINYFSFLSSHTNPGHVANAFKIQLANTSTILQAFGNAKTTTNDTSSRYGCLISLDVNERGSFYGPCVSTFYLEQSRCHYSPSQTFHIFQSLLCCLRRVQSGEVPIEEVVPDRQFSMACWRFITDHLLPSCPEEFSPYISLATMREVLSKMGVEMWKQSDMWKILLSVMILRTVEFTNDGDHSEVLSSSAAAIDVAAELLLLPITDTNTTSILGRTLCKQQVRDQTKPVSAENAKKKRDLLCKFLYKRLFDFLVNQGNKNVYHDQQRTGVPSEHATISILEMCSFESLNENYFEQLLINYSAESIRAIYERHQKWRGAISSIGEVQMSNGATVGGRSSEVLDLMYKSSTGRTQSLFRLLHDASYGPVEEDRRDSVFAQWARERLRSTLDERASVAADRMYGPLEFVVRHSVQNIRYVATDMVQANRERMPSDLANLLLLSESSFIRELLFVRYDNRIGTTAKRQESGTNAQMSRCLSLAQSMNALTERLSRGNCSFVMCMNQTEKTFTESFAGLSAQRQLVAGRWDELAAATSHPDDLPVSIQLTHLWRKIDKRVPNFLLPSPTVDDLQLLGAQITNQLTRCLNPCNNTKRAKKWCDVFDGRIFLSLGAFDHLSRAVCNKITLIGWIHRKLTLPVARRKLLAATRVLALVAALSRDVSHKHATRQRVPLSVSSSPTVLGNTTSVYTQSQRYGGGWKECKEERNFEATRRRSRGRPRRRNNLRRHPNATPNYPETRPYHPKRKAAYDDGFFQKIEDLKMTPQYIRFATNNNRKSFNSTRPFYPSPPPQATLGNEKKPEGFIRRQRSRRRRSPLGHHAVLNGYEGAVCEQHCEALPPYRLL